MMLFHDAHPPGEKEVAMDVNGMVQSAVPLLALFALTPADS